MTGFRVSIERKRPKGGRETRHLPLVGPRDMRAALEVVEDFMVRARHHAPRCEAITIVVHLPDCDHEP